MSVTVTSPHRPALSRTVRLEAALSAVSTARREVAAAVCEWDVAIEPDTAVLLTSELVANAVTHGVVVGEPVWLVIICFGDQLRVEVHDPSGYGIEREIEQDDPRIERGIELKGERGKDHGIVDVGFARSSAEDESWEGESGRGLAIVDALADAWGWQPTGWGKAVYFSLSSVTVGLA